ncbi:peptidoglycan DD-metalloendopeptidase family protein [candidate division KSB1 bacterium]|nr:peptidoglycan DD-metalloendopeptidase family protein [candidate division KSB1 bacterium]
MKSDFFTHFFGKPSIFILIILLGLFLLYPETKQKMRSMIEPSRNPRQSPNRIAEYPQQKSNPLRNYPLPAEVSNFSPDWRLPIDTGDRTNWNSIIFESDAHFMAYRRYRGNQLRYHTGIDMQNGGEGGLRGGPGEPVYSMGPGIVLGTFEELPDQRVVIEHLLRDGRKVWTAYVHVTHSLVQRGQRVDAFTPIARRMSVAELERYGMHYNHVHVEVMKKLPPVISGQYVWMTFHCTSPELVDEYFYDPKYFVLQQINR